MMFWSLNTHFVYRCMDLLRKSRNGRPSLSDGPAADRAVGKQGSVHALPAREVGHLAKSSIFIPDAPAMMDSGKHSLAEYADSPLRPHQREQ